MAAAAAVFFQDTRRESRVEVVVMRDLRIRVAERVQGGRSVRAREGGSGLSDRFGDAPVA
jgi:hypothetical protein